jgi:hypothetical protein
MRGGFFVGDIMYDPVRDPCYWRDRADRTRARANSFHISETERRRLLKIAAEYDRVATHAMVRMESAPHAAPTRIVLHMWKRNSNSV